MKLFFKAVAGYYYNVHNTNKLFNLSLDHDLEQFKKTTKHLCSMSWNQVILNRDNVLPFILKIIKM